ncbi:MAG TPA: penicillin-binding transpeptidase domain-containing protein [Pirellulales bacterium]|nr:penicillin-binding transpeptidase domain-containing protein [Pirellulales bacterium]
MARPQQFFDWQEIVDDPAEPVADSRVRLRWILVLFGLALAVVFARAVQLELTDGATYRELSAKPLERTVMLAANRGRIVARDGTPLAEDRRAVGLAVHFRYLETPSDPEWLRRLARSRLARADRRQPERVAAMEEKIRGELADLHHRLAAMCKLSDEQWQARADRIRRSVQALADRVNRRRLDRFEERAAREAATGELSAAAILAGLFAPPERVAPPSVLVVEQTAYHRVVDDVPSEIASEVKRHAKDFPGAKIVEYTRRAYPLETSAAHLVGHVGSRAGLGTTVATDAGQNGDQPVGLMGIERQYESTLRGQAGCYLQSTDHSGRLVSSVRERKPAPGRDVVLTIDARLQLSSEQLLDRAIRRRGQHGLQDGSPAGGAIVALDVRTGEVLCAASGPRFDPNLFAIGSPRVEDILHDPRQPLFDRVAKMAIPPGSVFKPVTALALLDGHVIEPSRLFHCQGFWNDSDRLRCQIFRQHGMGHGDILLCDALAQSCNVYFFHHVAELGAAPLTDWASRFGFGQVTGIDLADEAAGQLPTPGQLRQLSQTQAMAIGQGAFTATPLQVVRMYAAIANGGYLITPRLTRSDAIASPSGENAVDEGQISESLRIPGLTPGALDAVREGLRRAVDDPNGTAFSTVRLSSLSIAGKTGTAQTGGEHEDHAWFAGYVPADAPRIAFVVVLEHAGSGATAAGSVAKALVQRLEQLGYFAAPKTAEKSIPPGKG